MSFKKIVINSINYEELEFSLDKEDIENEIVKVEDPSMGDFALPCFKFASRLKMSPVKIAEKISLNIKDKHIQRVEVVNGYLNFFLKKDPDFIKNKIEQLNVKNCFTQDIGKGSVVCFDYNSANLGKHMHIGHLLTTMIGESLARLFSSFGYSVKRINYVGDYGTPFGKMVVGYKKWGDPDKLEKLGADYLQDLYVKFTQESENNPKLSDEARLAFSNIENKKGDDYNLYKKFVDISIRDIKRFLSNRLGVEFDSWKGEASYSNQIPKVVEELKSKNLLKKSQGSEIIDLEEFGLGVAPVIKKDGASLYIARDIAAVIDRYKNYKFDKMLYVVAVEQIDYFKKLFKIMELMGYDFAKGMEHIFYGMISLPTGKISSRLGKQATITDLLDMTESRVENLIQDRQFEIENKANVIKSVAKSTLAFVSLKNDRRKDSVFDPKQDIAFEGDTAPYLMYTYARIKSVLRKYKHEQGVSSDYTKLPLDDMFEIIKELDELKETAKAALYKREPAIIARKSLSISKAINKFYTQHKILEGKKEEVKAKVEFLRAVINALDFMLDILCFDKLDEM